MTTKPNTSKYSNANLNSVLQKPQASHGNTSGLGAGKIGYHGMLVLSKVCGCVCLCVSFCAGPLS